jgi:hypothetical protein
VAEYKGVDDPHLHPGVGIKSGKVKGALVEVQIVK